MRPWRAAAWCVLLEAALLWGSASAEGAQAAHGDQDQAAHGEHAEHSSQHDVLFYLFNSILLGTLVIHVTSYVPMFGSIQPTVAIFALGMFYALALELSHSVHNSGVVGESYGMWMLIDPHLLLFTLLPLLLTGDAMTIDTSVARLVAKQCLYLAGPGVVICTAATGAFLYAYLPYDWPFLLCITLGTILAATDPVAVVSLLKELGASPILTCQIQGESLLNDGTAIVIFGVCYDLLKGEHYGLRDMAMFLVKTALCAWLLGCVIGGIFVLWIRGASNRHEHTSTMIQISLTLCCAYTSFYVAEGVLGISGVLSTVASSLVLADNMWAAVVNKEAMHEVWHVFEFFGNTVIFFLAGSLTAKSMVDIHYKDYMYLFFIYIVLTLVRAGMLFISRPILQYLSPSRTPVSKADALVMTWGGLRGAVGLALAILVSNDRAGGKISKQDGDRVLFYTGGIASLTLLINATTCPAIVQWLGVTQTTSTKKHILLNLYQQLQKQVQDCDRSEAVKQIVQSKLDEIEQDICPEGLEEWQFLEKQAKRSSQLRDSIGGLMAKTRDLIAADTGNDNFFSGTEIVDQMRTSQARYDEVKVNLKKLGSMPEVPVLAGEQNRLEFIKNNSPDPDLLRALKECFLAMVRQQYWMLIGSGMFPAGSKLPDMCLNSISHALHHASEGFKDLAYIEDVMLLRPLQARKAPVVDVKSRGLIGRLLKQISSRALPRRSPSIESIANNFVRSASEKERSSLRWKARIRSSLFKAFMCSVIFVNTSLILTEDVSADPQMQGLVVDLFFTLIFFVEFLLKFGFLGKRYFWDAWNMLDFICLILAVAGTVFRVLIMTSWSSSQKLPSELEMLRLGRAAIQTMRLFRAATIFKFWRLAWTKFNNWSAVEDPELGRSLDIILAMKAMALAHIGAHHGFVRYFAEGDTFESVEEVMTVVESRVLVQLALTRTAKEVEKLDPHVLSGLTLASQSTELANDITHFIFAAQAAGIISSGEAEKLDHPFKMHGQEAEMVRADAHVGLEHPHLAFYKDVIHATAFSPRASREPVDDVDPKAPREGLVDPKDGLQHHDSAAEKPDHPWDSEQSPVSRQGSLRGAGRAGDRRFAEPALRLEQTPVGGRPEGGPRSAPSPKPPSAPNTVDSLPNGRPTAFEVVSPPNGRPPAFPGVPDPATSARSMQKLLRALGERECRLSSTQRAAAEGKVQRLLGLLEAAPPKAETVQLEDMTDA